MSSRKESLHIPIVDWLVKMLHKIKIPGFEGMNLYDLLEMYISGIVKGALTSRAGSIAFSFFIIFKTAVRFNMLRVKASKNNVIVVNKTMAVLYYPI